MSPLRFSIGYSMPVLLLFAAQLGGAWIALPALVVFVLLPIADGLAGDDWAEPSDGARHPAYDLLLRAWFPTQLVVLAAVAWTLHAGRHSPVEAVALGLVTGLVTGGSGITIAHELMHRRARHDRALAELLMLTALYPWFCVEHVQGHHRTVSTPDDPAFAPRGLPLFRYLPRTVLGGLRSAWTLETQRVQRRGVRGLADRRWRYTLELALVGLALWLVGGLVAVWFLTQAVTAVLLLETINYVEHYGLARAQRPSGRYERVDPRHSWNTPARLTNAYLFNLQRHADHHAFAARPYDQLRNHPGSPELPAGYPTMVLLALVPPLWFRIMNPRVDAVAAQG